MIKGAHSKHVNEKALRGSLILITVFSWFIFPLMAKQLDSSAFNIGFAICVFAASTGAAITLTRNQLTLQPLQKLMLVCWTGYLLALLFATLQSASTYSLVQWCILFAKFLFFAFFLLYLNERYVVATLRIYANLMVVSVIFALIAVAAVAIGVEPLATVDLGGRSSDVYFGAYYAPNTAICAPFPVFRIQGLSEEPGTYAFALLPAFFWLVIAEKSYTRSVVIVLGLMFSMSLGAGLFLLILLPIVAWKYRTAYKVPVFFLSTVCVIGLTFNLSGYCTDRHLENLDDQSIIEAALGKTANAAAIADYARKEGAQRNADRREHIGIIKQSLSTSSLGKEQSLRDRMDGIRISLNYLRKTWIGTGTALGMSTVKNSISVGYAVAILEAGLIGGVFYLCLFAIMGWLALKTIITSNDNSFDEQVKIVVALSVCTVLVMGTQRMQPDLSLWHMWIYAMWFYLLQITPASKNISERSVTKNAT